MNIKTFGTYLVEGVNDPGIFKVIYVAGPAAAGKGYIISNVTAGLGLRIVNSDTTFEHMLKKANIEPDFDKMDDETAVLAQNIRRQSRKKMFIKKDNHISSRLGMIIDSPGTKYHFIADDKYKLESLGYETMMVFCAVKMSTAKERNQNRERKIPSATLEDDYKQIMGNIKAFERLFGKDFILVNSENTSESELNDIWKRVMKFVNAPVTNKAALLWIDKIKNPEKYIKKERDRSKDKPRDRKQLDFPLFRTHR